MTGDEGPAGAALAADWPADLAEALAEACVLSGLPWRGWLWTAPAAVRVGFLAEQLQTRDPDALFDALCRLWPDVAVHDGQRHYLRVEIDVALWSLWLDARVAEAEAAGP